MDSHYRVLTALWSHKMNKPVFVSAVTETYLTLVGLPPVAEKDNDDVTVAETDEYDDREFYFWRPYFLPKAARRRRWVW